MTRTWLIAVGITLLGLSVCPTCPGQVLREKPDVARGIGVEQKIGNMIPADLTFHDDQNRFVRLGDLFDGRRPVILSFNFSSCPRLCIVQFNNLVNALRDLDLEPDRDFQIVSISFDWRDKPATVRTIKQNYLVSYGKLDTADGWHFLVGNQNAIEQAADACGIGFRYIPEQDSFSHPSAFIFCSPQGKIVRYLNGLDGQLEQSLKPAIIEAGEGRVGSLIDKALYFASCYEYDPVSGKYSVVAMRLMKWAGALTVLGLLIGLVPYWIGRRRESGSTDNKKNSHPPLIAAPNK
jgi:protein SCO1/2